MHSISRSLTAATRLPALLALISMALPSQGLGAVFEVTRADDPAPDGCLVGDCSLREALAAAAATPEADLILLQAGNYQVGVHLLVTGAVEIRGAGSELTQIASVGATGLLRVGPFAQLSVQGARLRALNGFAIGLEHPGTIAVRDVQVPADGGRIGTPDTMFGEVDILVEHSVLADSLYCRQDQGSCSVVDSEVHADILVQGDSVQFELARSVVGPPTGAAPGIAIGGNAAVTISESTVRNSVWPLLLFQQNPVSAPPVEIRRTRFIDNLGPLSGNRMSTVRLEEVEFRDHQVPQGEASSISDRPAVLLAQIGPTWRLQRVLIAGSRGGASYGGAITIEPGGTVLIFNSTFHDNTFHPQAVPIVGAGHTIGIFGNGLNSASLSIGQSTLRRATGLAPDAPGSLLAVRWDSAQVLLANTLLRGTCAFGAGGAISGATTNIESPGDTCQLDPGNDNQVLPESALRMGTLADHGGFTHSYEPDPGSALLDAGQPVLCASYGLDQRRHLRLLDGSPCDIGAVEAGALADQIFADGF